MNYTQSDVQDLIKKCLQETDVSCISLLENILCGTDDLKIIRIISFAFADMNNPIVLPVLVKMISQRKTYKRGRASLVYACENFDCTPYFNLFFNLALHDVAIVQISAIEIISKMNFQKMQGSIASYINELERSIFFKENMLDNKLLFKLLIFLKSKEQKKYLYKYEYNYIDIFKLY